MRRRSPSKRKHMKNSMNEPAAGLADYGWREKTLCCTDDISDRSRTRLMSQATCQMGIIFGLI